MQTFRQFRYQMLLLCMALVVICAIVMMQRKSWKRETVNSSLDKIPKTAPILRQPQGFSASVLQKPNDNSGHALGKQIQPPKSTLLNYGSAKGELGIRRQSEALAGPESFTISSKGELFICDPINKRISVLDGSANLRRTISLGEVTPSDIAVLPTGDILVFDSRNLSVNQILNDGQIRNSVTLPSNVLAERGWMRLTGDRVSFVYADQTETLIGTIRDGVFELSGNAEPNSGGIRLSNGTLFQLSLDRGVKAVIHITSLGVTTSTEMAVAGIGTVAFIGEDAKGGIFVQTERMDGQQVILEARRLNEQGIPTAIIRIPENDYASWTVKLLDVSLDGQIIQMLPQTKQAKINMFSINSQ